MSPTVRKQPYVLRTRLVPNDTITHLIQAAHKRQSLYFRHRPNAYCTPTGGVEFNS